MPTVPNLLIVGAMKCATTSLYELLAAHPEIYGPEVKEPAFLAREHYSVEHCGRLYDRLFVNAPRSLYRLEGSTGYTMRPRIEGCAERAQQMLGKDIRIIYMIREPLGRIRSHYLHLLRSGRTKDSFAEACINNRELIDFSRYFYQIAPWVSEFGKEKVYIMDFHRFCEDPTRELVEIGQFLGLEDRFTRAECAANVGSQLPRLPGWVNKIQRSSFYKTRVASLVSQGAKRHLTGVLGRKPPQVSASYSRELAEGILGRLSEDYSRLVELLPFAPEDAATIWSFERLIDIYTTPHFQKTNR